MARRLLINEHELDALDGLPHLAVVLYIKAIRPYMDYATGITGIKRGISYQSMSEQLYIEPEQGRHNSGSPTKSALRNAVKSLIKNGLLSVIPADKKIIFKCLLADTDKTALNNSDTSTTHINDTTATQSKPMILEALESIQEAISNIPKTQNSVIPPVSGNNISITTTTNTLKTVEPKKPEVVSGGCDINHLIFDKKLSETERKAIHKAIPTDIVSDAQALLDELAGAMQSPTLEIKNRVSYFNGIIKRFNSGEFIPTAGIAIAERREAEKREAERIRQQRQEMNKPKEQRNTQTTQVGRAAMKQALKLKKAAS